ncbi:uncharacterized protein LOC125662939 [Ostrea edulis]|uniref:uncharacterized protein LOC125662939 n=1 Tax=Ostrea edulis TaxID=37623 RepID=UPI0024AF2055|nr:uncharacterized protein LOC125662939 [Ostrea edulis]
MSAQNDGPSFSDDDVPSHTSLWTRNFMDKLGVVVRHERSPVSIIKEWSLSVLSEDNLKVIETMLPKAASCLKNIDFESLEDIWCAMKSDKLLTDLLKLIKLDTDFRYPASQPSSFGVRGEDFMFTLAYIIENMEEDKDIFEWQYQILFDKFIQMFGIISMQQPFIKSKKSLIMGKAVDSQPNLLCFTSDPRKKRSVLMVCEVNKNDLLREVISEDSPPEKKLRSTSCISSCVASSITDSLLAQHVGELFVYMDKSVTSRAVLGMTVERTHIRVTLLHANENALDKVKKSDGGGSVCFDAQEERPRFYYSKPLNYLKREDRLELVQSLLHIRMMQKKFEQ